VSEPVNILVVDDLHAQRVTIEAALQEIGEHIVMVSSGREALKYLLDHDAAVVLLDVNMPEMDGFETASLIRRRHRTAQTPIIFLTADTDEILTARGYALGAVDYIVRPFPPEVLRAKIQVFASLYRAQHASGATRIIASSCRGSRWPVRRRSSRAAGCASWPRRRVCS
jgi:DNA-binding response OmpR family regulator